MYLFSTSTRGRDSEICWWSLTWPPHQPPSSLWYTSSQSCRQLLAEPTLECIRVVTFLLLGFRLSRYLLWILNEFAKNDLYWAINPSLMQQMAPWSFLDDPNSKTTGRHHLDSKSPGASHGNYIKVSKVKVAELQLDSLVNLAWATHFLFYSSAWNILIHHFLF